MKPGRIHLPAASITSGQPVSSNGTGDTAATTPSRMPRVRVRGALPVPSNHKPSRMITSYVTVFSLRGLGAITTILTLIVIAHIHFVRHELITIKVQFKYGALAQRPG